MCVMTTPIIRRISPACDLGRLRAGSLMPAMGVHRAQKTSSVSTFSASLRDHNA
jgi:hypothetical protein